MRPMFLWHAWKQITSCLHLLAFSNRFEIFFVEWFLYILERFQPIPLGPKLIFRVVSHHY